MTSKKVLMISIVALLVLVILAGGIFFVVMRNKNAGEKEPTYYTHEIGEMYTNIKDSDSILKVNITLEYTDEDLAEALTAKHDKIFNGILELLRGKTREELNGAKGQQNARVDIRNLVREILKSEQISDVFFVEFIIQ